MGALGAPPQRAGLGQMSLVSVSLFMALAAAVAAVPHPLGVPAFHIAVGAQTVRGLFRALAETHLAVVAADRFMASAAKAVTELRRPLVGRPVLALAVVVVAAGQALREVMEARHSRVSGIDPWWTGMPRFRPDRLRAAFQAR